MKTIVVVALVVINSHAAFGSDCRQDDAAVFCADSDVTTKDTCYFGETRYDDESVTIQIEYFSGANPIGVAVGETLSLPYDDEFAVRSTFENGPAIVCSADEFCTFIGGYNGKVEGGNGPIDARVATDAIVGEIPCAETFDSLDYDCPWGCSGISTSHPLWMSFALVLSLLGRRRRSS